MNHSLRTYTHLARVLEVLNADSCVMETIDLTLHVYVQDPECLSVVHLCLPISSTNPIPRSSLCCKTLIKEIKSAIKDKRTISIQWKENGIFFTDGTKDMLRTESLRDDTAIPNIEPLVPIINLQVIQSSPLGSFHIPHPLFQKIVRTQTILSGASLDTLGRLKIDAQSIEFSLANHAGSHCHFVIRDMKTCQGFQNGVIAERFRAQHVTIDYLIHILKRVADGIIGANRNDVHFQVFSQGLLLHHAIHDINQSIWIHHTNAENYVL